jgi:Subtilisin inhibitor-like
MPGAAEYSGDMGRLAAAVVAVAVIASVTALAVAVAGSRGSAAKSSLTITYWANGTSSKSVKWTLRCGPVSGTLPRRVRACAKLKAGGAKLFAPLSGEAVCTAIWGGPQVARVSGKLGTRKIAATFSRTDGCQIDRWSKVSPWLLPPGGA